MRCDRLLWYQCGRSAVRGHGETVAMINDWLVMRYADRDSGSVDVLQSVRLKEGESAGGVQFFGKSTVVRFETEKRKRGTR
mgnify:CR=1 FL=1